MLKAVSDIARITYNIQYTVGQLAVIECPRPLTGYDVQGIGQVCTLYQFSLPHKVTTDCVLIC